jgi:anaerobic ribonucleoside-triphosphate reductase activating protein
LACLDVLLAGRFHASQRVARGLLGSRNKTVHFLTDRYQATDLNGVPEAELFVGSGGELTVSGIEPLVV